MADFEEYAEITSRCTGNEAGVFIDAYYKNQELQTEVVIEGSLVALAIVELMKLQDDWSGTATGLLTDLESIADGLKIDSMDRSWPRGSNALSCRINEIRTNLREVGISIEYDRHRDLKRSRIIKIGKISSIPSHRPTGRY
jgi:hypothetical protein